MRVEEIMQKDVLSISPSTKMEEAGKIMRTYGVRHLPVLSAENNELIGMVSDRDLQGSKERMAADIMITSVHTAFPGDFVEEAANMMLENKIHSLPVIDWQDQLIGMLTDSDLLKTLVRLSGADQPTSRVEIEASDQSGELANITAVAKSCSQNIKSIYTVASGEERMRIVMRLQTMHPNQFVETLKSKGYKVRWPEDAELEQ